MKLFTKSRDGLYEANATYENGIVKVLEGSRINTKNSNGFKPPKKIKSLRLDKTKIDEDGYLHQDVEFDTLSTAATFVTGRVANGMIVWKTEDGKYVRHTINRGK